MWQGGRDISEHRVQQLSVAPTKALERMTLGNHIANVFCHAKLPLEVVNRLFKAPSATVRRGQRAIRGGLGS